jgi:hypothetical protein
LHWNGDVNNLRRQAPATDTHTRRPVHETARSERDMTNRTDIFWSKWINIIVLREVLKPEFQHQSLGWIAPSRLAAGRHDFGTRLEHGVRIRTLPAVRPEGSLVFTDIFTTACAAHRGRATSLPNLLRGDLPDPIMSQLAAVNGMA